MTRPASSSFKHKTWVTFLLLLFFHQKIFSNPFFVALSWKMLYFSHDWLRGLRISRNSIVVSLTCLSGCYSRHAFPDVILMSFYSEKMFVFLFCFLNKDENGMLTRSLLHQKSYFVVGRISLSFWKETLLLLILLIVLLTQWTKVSFYLIFSS